MSESVCIVCWIGAWAEGRIMHIRAPGKARIDSATASLCLLCVEDGDRTGKGGQRGSTREPSVLPCRCTNVRRFMDTVTDPPDAFESSYIRDSALRNTSGSTSMVCGRR